MIKNSEKLKEGRKTMKTFLMQKGKAGVKKSMVITLIMALIITMVPVNAFALTGRPCETDRADAELYPFPMNLNILNQYLYGSKKNETGKELWSDYYNSVPKEWRRREMPASLKSLDVGMAIINTRYRGSRSAAPVYFEPTNSMPSKNWHDLRIKELSNTKYSYQGPNNPYNQNIAFYVAEGSEFKHLLGYNGEWAAVWDEGGIDKGRGLSTTCGGIGREQYGSWKPGVYFVRLKDLYIRDKRNADENISQVTAGGTATCDVLVKTTPIAENYVMAGKLKSNQLVQVTNPTPINGHYQIYFRNGLYYVNTKWLNLKRSDENKPTIQYNAVVKTTDSVEIKSQASASATAVASAKDGYKIQVVKKNAGNGFSEVWFNSQRCYIPTKSLTKFTSSCSYNDVKKLGKAKGTMVLNGPWSAYGGMAYTPEAIKILKKYKMDEGAAAKKLIACNGMIPMTDGDISIVYGISKFVYKPEPYYKESQTIYKVLYDGKICYIPILNGNLGRYYNYYKVGKGKIKAKAETKWITTFISDNYRSDKQLETYKIKGHYYFKIDDIASLMSKMNKSFDVKFDKNAIVVNSMSPYKGTASLKKGDGKTRYAEASTMSIIWDGQVVGLTCYKINGKYFVSIEEIAYLTDSEIKSGSTGFFVYPTLPNEVEAYG